MKAVQELMNEHDGIQLMLSILQNVAEKIVSGMNVPAEELKGIMEFLTVFVDNCHHGKEEGFLFPALEAAGIAKDGGPIGVMLQEHERGRRHIADMKKALGDFTSSGINAAEFEKAVEEYVSLLNQHIFKENNVLFQMAEKVLSADEDKKLFDNFEKLEVERIGLGKHEEFHALMDTLADKYR
jgi:hemerythrin-like domain-containing protein